jgi:hypothetical protein
MAKNEASGHGRVGRIKHRSQTLNTQNKRWVRGTLKAASLSTLRLTTNHSKT